MSKLIFVPEKKELIKMEHGTGDNLLPEDIAEGYVDYLLYEQYPEEDKDLEDPDPVSGMVLSKKHIDDLEDFILDVLDDAYGDRTLCFEIMEQEGN